MGYTHYFHVNSASEGWEATWPRLIADTQTIIAAAGVPLTGPPDYHDGYAMTTPPIVSVDEGIDLNGVGKNGHEPLVIGVKEDGSFNFVKTARKPYDKVVACVLLRAAMLAPQAVELRSDGYWDHDWEWRAARVLYQRLWPQDELHCPWKEVEEENDDEENVDAPGGGGTGCAQQ
ncbi:hypothetical protein BP00DRAFT_456670 [Aspergillus indologenus CBS 114.80]|uniref:Uncharacterized protein n=1 Tax=Aspergillus indologenus CBS 114.80 TaxID=1450541 RepID=A0A2V5JA77_9EURO|nr:hypothetical protein BP00DRAFT_456670 [Aspergillus indologenus CBS 114.80]